MKHDGFVCLLLAALTGVFAVAWVNFAIPPFEDAAMLMRYADHLALGHGIVWNIGEPPLDGATDFLFMVIVAVVKSSGLSIETAVRLITITAHFASVALIYLGMRHVQQSGIVPAFVSALYFAVGPGLFLAAAYFGTPVFVLSIAVAWLCAQRLLLPGRTTFRAYLWFSLSCLVAGLIRPEGVFISLFMLAGIGVLLPRRDFLRLAATLFAVFLLLGGTYFIWRWNYFDHMLPNPFYKKGGGSLYLGSLKRSLLYSWSLTAPFIPAFALGLRSRARMRQVVAFSIPIIGTVVMWLFLSDEMNFGGRFQYPVFVLCLLGWYPLIRGVSADLGIVRFSSLSGLQRASIGLAALVVVISLFARQIANSSQFTYFRDGRFDVGMMLSQYADRRYTIATTEAGLLPLYSRWRAIDTWGLNDRWIARNGEITYDYLAQQKPDLIVWHGYFSPIHAAAPEYGNPWFRQVMTLRAYAEREGFTLAAVFGPQPNDTHYYYVRTELPERDEIVQQIRSTRYDWYAGGQPCANYALLTLLETKR